MKPSFTACLLLAVTLTGAGCSAGPERVSQSWPHTYVVVTMERGDTVSELCEEIPIEHRGASIETCTLHALAINSIADESCIPPGTALLFPVATVPEGSTYLATGQDAPTRRAVLFAALVAAGILLVGIGLAGIVAALYWRRPASVIEENVYMNTPPPERPTNSPPRPVDEPGRGPRFLKRFQQGIHSRNEEDEHEEEEEEIREERSRDGVTFEDALNEFTKASRNLLREFNELKAEARQVETRIQAAVADERAKRERAEQDLTTIREERERLAGEVGSLASRLRVAQGALSRVKQHQDAVAQAAEEGLQAVSVQTPPREERRSDKPSRGI